jgi:hypothetical protein
MISLFNIITELRHEISIIKKDIENLNKIVNIDEGDIIVELNESLNNKMSKNNRFQVIFEEKNIIDVSNIELCMEVSYRTSFVNNIIELNESYEISQIILDILYSKILPKLIEIYKLKKSKKLCFKLIDFVIFKTENNTINYLKKNALFTICIPLQDTVFKFDTNIHSINVSDILVYCGNRENYIESNGLFVLITFEMDYY